MLTQLRSLSHRYLCALTSIVFAVVLRWLLDPLLGDALPLSTSFVAIVFTAWYAGFLPALLVALLGIVAGEYFFISPRGSLALNDTAQQLFVFRYVMVSVVIAALGGLAQRIRSHAEQNADQINKQAVLIDQVYDAVLIWDWPTGSISFWNRGAEQLYGFQRTQALGRVSHQLLQTRLDRKPEQDMTAVLGALSERGEWQGELYHFNHAGQLLRVESRMVLIHNEPRPYVIETNRDVTAQQAVALLRSVLDGAHDAIVSSDESGRVLVFNRAGKDMFGWDAADVIGKHCTMLLANADDAASSLFAMQDGAPLPCFKPLELQVHHKQGHVFPVHMTVSQFELDQHRYRIWIMRDLRAQRSLELQLHQAQKQEAFGQLAGGVAHDFNNILTVIAGYADLLKDLLAQQEEPLRFVGEISRASARAADLTRQLLAFSRQQMLEPTVLELNSIVIDMERMLRRVIGEDIHFYCQLGQGLDCVRVDAGQIGQVIMNLVVNARDAMPHGGSITITTYAQQVDALYRHLHPRVQLGDHIVLSIADTGVGMTDEIKERIFEPFFTTKGVGKGTGLGLAVADGIVRQSGGSIEVSSQVGVGSRFNIYLPAIKATQSAPTVVVEQIGHGGGECILLVEDDHGARELMARALQSRGYQVLQAHNGALALELFERNHAMIDLLLTDLVMPEMSGRQLVESIRERVDSMRVLYVSGYTNDAVVRHGVQQAEVNFLHKPFSLDILVSKVREVLNAPICALG